MILCDERLIFRDEDVDIARRSLIIRRHMRIERPGRSIYQRLKNVAVSQTALLRTSVHIVGPPSRREHEQFMRH